MIPEWRQLVAVVFTCLEWVTAGQHLWNGADLLRSSQIKSSSSEPCPGDPHSVCIWPQDWIAALWHDVDRV